MRMYLNGVLTVNLLVNLLLILGTNRLSGFPPDLGRAVAASLIGGIYGTVCLLPELSFLGNQFWRGVFFLLVGIVAFGFSFSGMRRGAVFFLLTMALGGIASGLGATGFWVLLLCAMMLVLVCRFGFADGIGRQKYIPVELSWQGRTVRLYALQDTGNSLRDPLTGEQVLVCGADVGEELLMLPRSIFQDPILMLSTSGIPGLRLVPYQSVGNHGFMAALRMKKAKVNGKISDPLIAFAPQEIGKGEPYRMLTGGVIR